MFASEPRGAWLRTGNRRGQPRNKVGIASLETLEARTVLSATVLADLPTLDAATSGNNAPTAQNHFIFLGKTDTYTFQVSDFGFGDPLDFPPDQLDNVLITSAPAKGTITLNGSPVTSNQHIAAADITAGLMKYTPDDFGTGSFSASFLFQVQDTGQTINLSNPPNSFFIYVDNANATFVRHVYQDVLNREPDQFGFPGWLGQLNSGASRTTIAQGLWDSREHRGIQVDGYYQLFFNRQAAPAGRQAWITSMLNGATEEQVMASFLTTSEYMTLHPLDGPFVTGVYDTILDRTPDPAGQSHWVNQLSSSAMTATQVASALIHSQERNRNLVTADYERFFDRAPDTSGGNFWLGQLTSGALDEEGLAVMLMATSEYYNKT